MFILPKLPTDYFSFCAFWRFAFSFCFLLLIILFLFCRKNRTSATSVEKPSTAAPPSTRTRASTRVTNLSCASFVGKDFIRKVRKYLQSTCKCSFPLQEHVSASSKNKNKRKSGFDDIVLPILS